MEEKNATTTSTERERGVDARLARIEAALERIEAALTCPPKVYKPTALGAALAGNLHRIRPGEMIPLDDSWPGVGPGFPPSPNPTDPSPIDPGAPESAEKGETCGDCHGLGGGVGKVKSAS